jgi:hypothetical protein
VADVVEADVEGDLGDRRAGVDQAVGGGAQAGGDLVLARSA